MISGIVLAGGESRRFGGDKLAERIHGRSLIELAARSLPGVVDEIVVVVAPGRPLPELDLGGDPPPLRFAPDPAPFEGPLAGLRTGLAAARGVTVVVIGGDMPSVVPAVLALLLGAPRPPCSTRPASFVRCRWHLERATALAAAERLLAGGERRLRALLAELGTEALPRAAWAAEDPGGLTLLDIDERSRSGPPAARLRPCDRSLAGGGARPLKGGEGPGRGVQPQSHRAPLSAPAPSVNAGYAPSPTGDLACDDRTDCPFVRRGRTRPGPGPARRSAGRPGS